MDIVQRDGYEEWILSDGERIKYEVEGGETIENVLVNQQADDACIQFNIREGTTMRNVGFDGEGDITDLYQMYVWTDEEVTIENVYMDCNRYGATDTQKVGAIGGANGRTGVLHLNRVFIRGYGNNATYTSSNSGGETHARNCYFINNVSGTYRMDSGSTVRHCVGILHDPDCRRQEYSSGSQGCRGVWPSRAGTVHVSDSSFWWSSEDCNLNEVFEADPQGSESGPVSIDIDGPVYVDAPSDRMYQNPDNVTGKDNVQSGATVGVMTEGVPLSPDMAVNGEYCIPPEIGSMTYPREYGRDKCGSDTLTDIINLDGENEIRFTDAR